MRCNCTTESGKSASDTDAPILFLCAPSSRPWPRQRRGGNRLAFDRQMRVRILQRALSALLMRQSSKSRSELQADSWAAAFLELIGTQHRPHLFCFLDGGCSPSRFSKSRSSTFPSTSGSFVPSSIIVTSSAPVAVTHRYPERAVLPRRKRPCSVQSHLLGEDYAGPSKVEFSS